MKNRLICIALLLCVLLSACGGGKPETGEALYAERGTVERLPLGELAPAKDAEAILRALSAAGQSRPDWEEEEAVPEAGLRLSTAETASGASVLTDGSRLYMTDSYGLVVFSAAGGQSQVLSYTRIPRRSAVWSERLFLEGDRIAVVFSADETEEDDWQADSVTHAVLLDISDPLSPAVLADTAVEGGLVEACLSGGTLYLVTQNTLLSLPEKGNELLPRIRERDQTLRLEPGDVYLSPEPARAALTVVAALRMEDGRVRDALAFTDGTEAVRIDGQTLYLSRTIWTQSASEPYREEPYRVVDYTAAAKTELRRIRLEDGLRLDGGCMLEGALTDPGALALSGDGLRLALNVDSRAYSAYTDEKHGWTNYETRSHDRGCCLALLDSALRVVGSLRELGGEQGVGDCRFTGALAWLSVPGSEAVYPADLSDPAAPALCGSLSLTGESLLLRPFGDGKLLGLVSPEAEEPWTLVMFDVSDPSAPRELDRLELKNRTPASELSAPGVLLADAGNCLIGFPTAGEQGNSYLLIRWTDSGFKLQGELEPEYLPADARGLLLDGLLYLCSPGVVCAADPETMTIIKSVSNAVG